MSKVQTYNYDFLKSKIANKTITRYTLDSYKNYFKEEIDSTRTYARIKTLGELLDCLESRDVLSEYSIEPLRIIANHFADDELDICLQKYFPPSPSQSRSNLNEYGLERLKERNRILAQFQDEPKKNVEKPLVVIEFTQEKRDNIYKIIAKDIGSNWRSLGRELRLRAGELDGIETKHPSNLQSRVYEILQTFESDSYHNRRDHYDILCEALDRCQRKDIRRDVQKIMRNS